MADIVGIARLDDFIGEQMQAPALASGGRGATNGSDEKGFGITVEFAGFAMGLLFAKESGLKVTFDKTSAHELGSKGADTEFCGDVLIVDGSCLLIGIGHEQDLGSVAFSWGAFVGSGNDFQLLALLPRKSDMVLFGGHESLLIADNAERIPDPSVKYYYLEEVLACFERGE